MAGTHSAFGMPRLVEIRHQRRVMIKITSADSVSTAWKTPKFASILLLHGSLASRRQFRELITELADLNVAVVSFDALGCGESEKPDGWSMYAEKELYADAEAVLDRYCEKPTLLVGHSFGSNLAMQIAAAKPPQVVAGLVLLAPSLHNPLTSAHIFLLPEWILCCFRHTLNQQFLAMAYHPRTSRAMVADAYAECSANPWHVVRSFYRQLIWACTSVASTICVPALIVAGEGDGIFPAEKTREVSNAIKGSSYVTIAEAAHQMMQERPHDVFVAIYTFLRQNALID